MNAGVYGRVAHLADIQDKRYVLALTAAMGKDFDGIIVKDGERWALRPRPRPSPFRFVLLPCWLLS